MPDPNRDAGHQPPKSITPEEGGHRVTSPGHADAAGDDVPEPPEYGETIDDLDVPSDVEPQTGSGRPA